MVVNQGYEGFVTLNHNNPVFEFSLFISIDHSISKVFNK